MKNKTVLKSIYGTLEDIESNCNSTASCWENYFQYKLGYAQTPYFPYFGENYKQVLFCGINLNRVVEKINLFQIFNSDFQIPQCTCNLNYNAGKSSFNIPEYI